MEACVPPSHDLKSKGPVQQGQPQLPNPPPGAPWQEDSEGKGSWPLRPALGGQDAAGSQVLQDLYRAPVALDRWLVAPATPVMLGPRGVKANSQGLWL